MKRVFTLSGDHVIKMKLLRNLQEESLVRKISIGISVE